MIFNGKDCRCHPWLDRYETSCREAMTSSPKGLLPPQREAELRLTEELLPVTASPKVSRHSQHAPGRSDSLGPQQYDQTERSCRQTHSMLPDWPFVRPHSDRRTGSRPCKGDIKADIAQCHLQLRGCTLLSSLSRSVLLSQLQPAPTS